MRPSIFLADVRALRVLFVALVLALGGCDRAEADAARINEAKQSFATLCARCHGADGSGGLATAGGSAPRNFREADFQTSRTDAELFRVIQQGKGAMPSFATMYDEKQVAALVSVIRSFNPEKKP